MRNIVFDIETAGYNFDSLPETVQTYILKYAINKEEEEAEKEKLGLWPLTGQVITIAMLYDDTQEGYVFFQAPNKEIKSFEDDKIKFITGTESLILKNFWKVILDCDKFITFNGRGFDCPFILIRSAIHNIKATRNLMPSRYSVSEHIDLMDQLTFYGAVRKRFSLDMWCQAFNIESPKQNYTGYDVGNLFRQERFLDIAKYCLSDVNATLKLYKYWDKYINV